MAEWNPIETYPGGNNVICFGGPPFKKILVWEEGTSLERKRSELAEQGYTHWITTPQADTAGLRE